MAEHHHGSSAGTTATPGATRIALVGAPNAGKSSLFNALTGLNVKTGNYPGVTVGRTTGAFTLHDEDFALEDLPGTYSLIPVSPDEEVVRRFLDGELVGNGIEKPEAVLVVVDVTTLERSLTLVAQVCRLNLPTCVVLTMTDELQIRRGRVNLAKLEQALGVPVVTALAHRRGGIEAVRNACSSWRTWSVPATLPPESVEGTKKWVASILHQAEFVPAEQDARTKRIDNVLLHPVWGLVVFMGVMFALFQAIFTVAAPLQDLLSLAFGALGDVVRATVAIPWLNSFLADAVIGGVGGMLVFVPQIMFMFLFLAVLEGSGYLARAAFLMDAVMAKAGLEGRAFVALLSSLACAIPGIMSTRTLSSSKDRIATMMAAPLMTCSARLPVYVLLIGMLVAPDVYWGPFQAQGLVMFALYLGGALAAMGTAWLVSQILGRRTNLFPFYLEMPPYRIPTAKTLFLVTWNAVAAFLRRAGTIILGASAVMWLLLNISLAPSKPAQPGEDNTLNTSIAAAIGHGLEPVFAPLGYNWQVNVAIVSSLTARETFVSTLGQIASADDPNNPTDALEQMTYTDGPNAGEKVFTPATIASLLVFFLFALQCVSTMVIMRRESGSWRWPALAFGYMFGLAWIGALITRTIVGAVLG
jgi:ferrous iron transport protein B